jgi:rhodanese-related sulfurtransferase
MSMTKHVSAQLVYDQLGLLDAPLLVDLRDGAELARAARMIPGAMHLSTSDIQAWSRRLPARRSVALYSNDDLQVEPAARTLANKGLDVCVLEGGFGAWLNHAYPTIRVRDEFGVPGRSQWVTRERPKIDRVACPWLIRRFIDPMATFFYVPAPNVRRDAIALGAQPYDIADVIFSHRGAHCSFDAFLDEFDLHDPILDTLAEIVRAADTGTLDLSREAPGLLAISLGLSATINDDLLLLEQAMTIYDALYAWCKTARSETHSWPQPQQAMQR